MYILNDKSPAILKIICYKRTRKYYSPTGYQHIFNYRAITNIVALTHTHTKKYTGKQNGVDTKIWHESGIGHWIEDVIHII